MLKSVVWIYYASFMIEHIPQGLALRLGKIAEGNDRLKLTDLQGAVVTSRRSIGTLLVAREDNSSLQASEAKALRQKEICEKLRSLKFSEIIISPEVPAEVALKEVGELYEENEIPDDVFFALYRQMPDLYTRLMVQGRGGMVNHWQPNEDELARYKESNPNYRSTRDQMYEDLLGRSGIPGSYRLFGLHTDKGELAAWLTCRVAPQSTAFQPAYAEYLHTELIEKLEVDVRADKDAWNRRFAKRFPFVMELDTINVREGYSAASDLILARTMGLLEKELPEAQMPQMIYFYRFGELNVIEPHLSEFPIGQNSSTAAFISRLGFTEIGTRKDDIVVRQVHNVKPLIVAEFKKRYSSGLWKESVRSCLSHSLTSLGLTEEEIFG